MNKNIKDFSPSLLVPIEMITCASSICPVVSRNVQGDAFIDKEIKETNTSVQNLETALHSKKENSYTSDLSAKNETRNTVIRSLHRYLEGMTGVEIKPELKTAAAYLLSVFNKQSKRVDKLSYTKKTGAVSAILDALKQPDAVGYITVLGIADMVQQLTTAQEEFAAAYQAKVKSDAKLATSFVARAEANEVSYHLTKLLHYIDAQAQNNAAFGTVVSELNTVIADIMSKAHGRKTRGKTPPISVVPASPISIVPKTDTQAKAA